MKHKKKSIITVALTTLVAFVLAMAYSYKEWSQHKCRTCHSFRYYSKWAVGDYAGPSVTIWSREIIRQSTIYRIMFDEDHEHDWEHAHSSCRNIFPFLTAGYHASGSARSSEFVAYYEELPPFREFIDKKIAEGKLTHGQLYQILALSPKAFERENTDAHTSELVHLAKQLVI